MIGQLDVDDHHEGPGAESLNKVATLAGVAPNLELESVTTDLIQVLFAVKTQLLLPIVPTVIVVPKEVVIGRHTGN